MIDRDALVAQQLAEHQARLAQAGRYDNTAVKDIARRVEMEHMALSWARKASATTEPADPDAPLRELAASNPCAAAAFQLRNQGYPVTALDENGAPLVAPTRDPAVMAAWWQPGGPYVDKWPGVPCGPEGGYFGLLLGPEGKDWFRKIATVHHPSRAERPLYRPVDPVDEMGVPRPGVDDWEDDEPRAQPDEIRAPMAATLWLAEDLPAHRPVMRSWFGELRGRSGQAAMMAGKPNQARQLSGMVWNWPHGETLPVGRELRKGAWSLAALPALGAELIVGGVRFVVRQTPSLLSNPPDWVIGAIQGLA